MLRRKKVQRIMKLSGWRVRCLSKGFRPRVTASRSVGAFANQRWATDMTHFFCKEAGWCHVIVVIDRWNRDLPKQEPVLDRACRAL
jgi:putative transposase